jgi:hypothetical protein
MFSFPSPPHAGESGKRWGPAIASPRCAAPRPAKGPPPLGTLLHGAHGIDVNFPAGSVDDS